MPAVWAKSGEGQVHSAIELELVLHDPEGLSTLLIAGLVVSTLNDFVQYFIPHLLDTIRQVLGFLRDLVAPYTAMIDCPQEWHFLLYKLLSFPQENLRCVLHSGQNVGGGTFIFS
jgi:hypothetical protein